MAVSRKGSTATASELDGVHGVLGGAHDVHARPPSRVDRGCSSRGVDEGKVVEAATVPVCPVRLVGDPTASPRREADALTPLRFATVRSHAVGGSRRRGWAEILLALRPEEDSDESHRPTSPISTCTARARDCLADGAARGFPRSVVAPIPVRVNAVAIFAFAHLARRPVLR